MENVAAAEDDARVLLRSLAVSGLAGEVSSMLVNQLAQMVVRGNPDVLGVLVVDGDGQVIASEASPPDVVQAALALTVPLRELLDRTAAELGCGEMRATLIEGQAASLALADIDGFRTVVVIGATGAPGGALRADCLWVAERVRNGASS